MLNCLFSTLFFFFFFVAFNLTGVYLGIARGAAAASTATAAVCLCLSSRSVFFEGEQCEGNSMANYSSPGR